MASATEPSLLLGLQRDGSRAAALHPEVLHVARRTLLHRRVPAVAERHRPRARRPPGNREVGRPRGGLGHYDGGHGKGGREEKKGAQAAHFISRRKPSK